MATRIKDGMIPYTWWDGIEITNNHVINVLLRELNNLIHVNEDRELYVDLQLDDWIQPDDDFPVGVTTGKILQEDWWIQSWIILNWKTTSGDYVRFIYANDGKLYYDPWTWIWIEIWWWGSVQINVATASSLWLIKLGSDTQQTESQVTATSVSGRTYPVQLNADNQAVVNVPWEEYLSLVEAQGGVDVSLVTTWEKYTWNHKQDKLTAWANITIDQNNEISATIPSALIYKGTVNDLSDLPSSWTVGDTYFVVWEDGMYSWTWTQWDYVWGTGIDTSDLFNKTIDTSDDIVQGTTNLFVTASEKADWNWKQDPIQAGQNITIDPDGVTINAIDTKYTAWDWINIDVNNVISNTDKFDPENAGSMWQFLKKTNTGYAWATIPWWWNAYSAGDGININNNNVISNTKPFDPTNTATIGYVLKASGRDSYYRAPESWWGGWGWNFNPQHSWTEWQILTKGSWNTYDWKDLELPSGENNVKFWTLDSDSYLDAESQAKLEEIWDWVQADENNWAIINDTHTNDVFIFNSVEDYQWHLRPTFYGKKRISNVAQSGTYTIAYEQRLQILEWPVSWYILSVWMNPDDSTHTNYLSADPVWYTDAFMPIYDTQPASKWYVDAVAAGSVSVPAITNNTTGTTYTLSQEWVGTQAQYNALVSWWQVLNWVIYNIIPSS